VCEVWCAAGIAAAAHAAAPARRVTRLRGRAVAPLQVVAAQLDALQRNDWPDADAGVRAAFAFSKPADAETLLPGQVGLIAQE
jgi:hypothetical protein